MAERFLDKVYSARDGTSARKFYDKWSASYEAEVAENGYATPGRCAAALADRVADKTAPLLDFGCGTGLSGLALKRVGFETIDGVDLSAEMLAQARQKGIYRSLTHIEAGAPLPHSPGEYQAISAIGVIGAGAAPASIFHLLMKGLGAGGKMVFSFNDHALHDPIYEAALCEWLDCGAARLLFREHGPHLPGIDLKATVYLVEKL
ncbi:class I SAM-dependent DNA methyltransferase [Roseobacter weihaiensis]|uniref:class I SAM-dependent DNA methyltransferase n=1 Tax=Roseobacter weihaiensis TaxID=2763262 RepID=UPI001D0AC6A3|nr:methyltransferase domain-containing protein [Roseobacter sp. H9]